MQRFVSERIFVHPTGVCNGSSLNAGLSILRVYATVRLWTQVCPSHECMHVKLFVFERRFVHPAGVCNGSSLNAGLSILREYATIRLWTQVCSSRVQQFVYEHRLVHQGCNSSSVNADLAILRVYATVRLWTQICPSYGCMQRFVSERRFVHPTGVCNVSSVNTGLFIPRVSSPSIVRMWTQVCPSYECMHV